jgi:ribosomal protein L12E/L44/L45/RPP1/RPP2
VLRDGESTTDLDADHDAHHRHRAGGRCSGVDVRLSRVRASVARSLCGKVAADISTEGSNSMARPGPQTHAKRQREQAKKEKRRAKEEKKALRKAEKMANTEPEST